MSTRHTQAEITQFEYEQQMTRFERYKEYLRVNKLLTDEEATYIDNLIKKTKATWAARRSRRRWTRRQA